MPDEPKPSPANEGARLLTAAPGGLREKATRTGVSRESIRIHSAGVKVPAPAHRDAYLREFSIPIDAWDRVASGVVEVVSLASDKREPTSAEALDEIVRTLREQRRTPGLTPSTLTKIAAAETRAIELRDRLRPNGAALVESAEWKALEAALGKVLARHPLASLEVQAAIAGSTGDAEPAKKLERWRTRNADLARRLDALNAEARDQILNCAPMPSELTDAELDHDRCISGERLRPEIKAELQRRGLPAEPPPPWRPA